MRTAAGVALVLAAGALAAIIGGPLRERLPVFGVDVLMALAGAGIGAGGLLFLDDVEPASWVVAPAFVAVIAILHVRALFARSGPFRT